MQIEKLRGDFPFLKRVIYLDSAAVCPAPQPVVAAMQAYYEECPLNYGIGESDVAAEATHRVDAARAACASFFNARSADEIIFTKNCTEAINIVAGGLTWKPGDEIVTTALDHESNVIPWLRLGKRAGVIVRLVPVGPSGLLDIENVKTVLSPRTRLVAVTHMSNVFGTIQPVPDIVHLARSVGALTLVDMAQSAGRFQIDVQEIGCDFATFSGRKSLMGPQGTGILYGQREALEQLEPLILGGVAAHLRTLDELAYSDLPYRLEAGILNTAGVIGLGEATRYLRAIGLGTIHERIRELTRSLREGLRQIRGIELYGADDLERQGGIVAWNLKGRDPNAVARALYETGRVVALSGDAGAGLVMRVLGVSGVVRTSVQSFNTEEELMATTELVDRLSRMPGIATGPVTASSRG